jgi:hypothetical protein
MMRLSPLKRIKRITPIRRESTLKISTSRLTLGFSFDRNTSRRKNVQRGSYSDDGRGPPGFFGLLAAISYTSWISDSGASKANPMFHVSNIKPYHGDVDAKLRTPRISLTVEQDNLKIEAVAGHDISRTGVFVSFVNGRSTIQKMQVIDRLMTSLMIMPRFSLRSIFGTSRMYQRRYGHG